MTARTVAALAALLIASSARAADPPAGPPRELVVYPPQVKLSGPRDEQRLVVLGRTDRHGASTTQRPVRPADVAYTIYDALGIDPKTELHQPDGRPIQVLDQGSRINELYA